MKRVGRFDTTERLVWVTLGSAIGLQLLAVAVAGEASMPVLAASIPTMLLLVAAWSGITNWAEVKAPQLPDYPPPEK